MQEESNRLAAVESTVAEMKGQLSTILGALPYFATKEDVANLRAEVKEDIGALRAEMKGDIGALETRLVKWFLATAIALSGVVFTIARFVH